MSVRGRFPGAVLIFLVPPDLETLRARLDGRATDDEAVIRRRLENAKRELARFDGYDYVVVNDDVGTLRRRLSVDHPRGGAPPGAIGDSRRRGGLSRRRDFSPLRKGRIYITISHPA